MYVCVCVNASVCCLHACIDVGVSLHELDFTNTIKVQKCRALKICKYMQKEGERSLAAANVSINLSFI